MSDKIRVLIVDDIPETREHLAKLLWFEPDIEVVGAAASGEEAIELATAASRRTSSSWTSTCPGWTASPRPSALVAGPRGRRHHDERPGRGRLPAPLDAGGRARVPGQAVQLATSWPRRSARSMSASARSVGRMVRPRCRPAAAAASADADERTGAS